jgi:hypothetical protein
MFEVRKSHRQLSIVNYSKILCIFANNLIFNLILNFYEKQEKYFRTNPNNEYSDYDSTNIIYLHA